jgi:hypothetical protein
MRIMLASLIIWLNDHDRIRHESADEKLATLFEGAPAVVSAMHDAVNDVFEAMAFAPPRPATQLPN